MVARGSGAVVNVTTMAAQIGLPGIAVYSAHTAFDNSSGGRSCCGSVPQPPSKYRELQYQSPMGYLAIEQWYAGYQHGAAAAE